MIVRALLLASLLAPTVVADPVRAQSIPSPGINTGSTCSAATPSGCTEWTASQWAAAWQSKADYPINGFIPSTATGVSAGSYTCPNITVNAFGQLTVASTGSCSGGGGGGATAFEIDFFEAGLPYANATLAKTFSRPTTVAAAAAIKCNAIAGASASTTLTFYRIPVGTTSQTAIGTAVFAASGSAYQGCTAVWTNAVTFAVGDMLVVALPGTPDITLANIAVSIPASQ